MIIAFQIGHIMEVLLFAYLGFSALYLFIYWLGGFRYKLPKTDENKDSFTRFAVLIPAYKEDNVILNSVDLALEQNYPSDKFDIIVIADSILPSTLKKLRKHPIKIVEVTFKNSTKTKALNVALQHLDENRYDHALILDADNVMELNFLKKLNKVISEDCKVVQANRVAKNKNTRFALLDGISEGINNHIFRKGHRGLGVSSAIIGSAFSTEFKLLKETLGGVTAISGFDKELEILLLKDKYTIEYLETALVYDEKIANTQAFVKQRRRWIAAQVYYLRKFFFSSFYELIAKGNFNYFDKVLQFCLPPRILSLGFITAISLLSVFLQNTDVFYISYPYWIAQLTLMYIPIILSVPKRFNFFEIFSATISLPVGFIATLIAALRIGGANKQFIHTNHIIPPHKAEIKFDKKDNNGKQN